MKNVRMTVANVRSIYPQSDVLELQLREGSETPVQTIGDVVLTRRLAGQRQVPMKTLRFRPSGPA